MSKRAKLVVHFLSKGSMATDVRHGVNFRWTSHDGSLDVYEHDENHQIVWAKFYEIPISAEVTLRDTDAING